MSRDTFVRIDAKALWHNLLQVQRRAPGRKIIAMVKSNAYGCGLSKVVPVLEAGVSAFGVACLEEAFAIRALGIVRDCVLFQGVFNADELQQAAQNQFQVVLHQASQLTWLLEKPLQHKIRVWVKVNTGMNRLGFLPKDVCAVLEALRTCPWVLKPVGLMTHLACADEPGHSANKDQLRIFDALQCPDLALIRSIANSAALMSAPDTYADVVRPGIMLYGVSPFQNQIGSSLGLMPVMHFMSTVTAIHQLPAGAPLGYGGKWQTKRPSVIAVVSAGYGDGYPRHIDANTSVWIKGNVAPIVGQVSMDMITVDVTDCQDVKIGDAVELWGKHVPVEYIAHQAGTIAYELLCQFSPRANQKTVHAGEF